MAQRKRGNNEGSIRKRNDGRWEARVSAGGKQRSIYGKTREDVARKMRALQREVDQGRRIVTKKQSLAQFLDAWLEESVQPSVRPRTFQTYEMHCRLYLKPALGTLSLDQLGPQHVLRLQNDLLERGLAPSTVTYTRAVLRKALGQALQWGYVTQNAVTLVPAPKARRPEVSPLSPEQARVFLQAVKGDRLEALYTVALAVGLRQGEALGLRWQDVDLSRGTLSVRNALQRLDGEFKLVPPKTRKSRRTIPLPQTVQIALAQHQVRQLQEREAAGAEWHDWGLVFTTPLGMPLDGVSVTKSFQKRLRELGLPHQRFHDLRHACASFLLAQGLSPRVVMETLGHSQISLTMDTYAHVMPSLQREAADRMDDLLREDPADSE